MHNLTENQAQSPKPAGVVHNYKVAFRWRGDYYKLGDIFAVLEQASKLQGTEPGNATGRNRHEG